MPDVQHGVPNREKYFIVRDPPDTVKPDYNVIGLCHTSHIT